MSKGAKRSKRASAVSRLRALIAAVIVIMAFCFVCRTEQVAVRGNIHVSAEGIRTRLREQPVYFNSVLLYLYNKVMPITDDGFIDSVSVSLAGPTDVVATVHEKKLAGYLAADGRYWYFDAKGIIRAVSGTPDTEIRENVTYLPCLEGITPGRPAIGDPLPGAGTVFYERLGELQTMLNKNRMIPDKVTVDENYSLTLTYGEIRAELGDMDHLDARIRILADVLPQAEGMKGTFRLADYDGTEEGVVFQKD